MPSRMSSRIERAKTLFKQLQNQLKQQLVKDVGIFNGRVAKAVEAAQAVHKLSELAMALEVSARLRAPNLIVRPA